MSAAWKPIAGGLGAAALGAVIAVAAMQGIGTGRGGGADPKATGEIVRAYILDHPEIIPEAMDRLQTRQTAALVAAHREAIETPFAGAVQGNPKGDVTLVEYFDYACGYCRQSVADVDRLVASDPGVRVIYKELPILSAWSGEAAKLSLAAARAGKFVDFHHALYGAGQPGEGKAEAIARQLHIDPSSADSPAITGEIETNLETARALRLSGTPSFVVGGDVLSGAVGYDGLKAAVAKARAAAKA